MAAPTNREVQRQGLDDAQIDELILRLESMRKKHGERSGEFPKMNTEAEQLTEKNESVFESVWSKIRAAFNFLVVKPVTWVGHQVVDHPFRTLILAFSAFAGYKAYNLYKGVCRFLSPLSSALAGLKETGLKITKSLLPEAKSIDPTQSGFFDRLMQSYSAGNVSKFLEHPIDQGLDNLKRITGSK